METRDTVNTQSSAPAPEESAESGRPGRVSIDRFEMKPQWSEREEEERVEEAAVLYEKAVRQRIPAAAPEPPDQTDIEALEAISQELKLRQKCQDIAALILADEQGLMDSLDEDE